MPDVDIALYRKMFLIRAAEKTIRKYYNEDEMKTPMHMSMGEEAVVAGVCQALSPGDQVLGTYRSHALYLARTGETDRFFAEMYGKASGIARGKAGSMHLGAPEAGLLCCSAIVGSSIPVALGAAFAHQYRQSVNRVAVFFGDGAVDEGVFWESLNFACLKKLPILFVCEDNGFAVHTRRAARHGFESLNAVVRDFNCNVYASDSTDARIIHDLTGESLAQMERDRRPVFLRLKYYRYLEHVGINEDFEAGYRSKETYRKWLAKDPVRMGREKLLQAGVASAELERIEQEIEQQITASVRAAKQAKFADASELCKGVFQCA